MTDHQIELNASICKEPLLAVVAIKECREYTHKHTHIAIKHKHPLLIGRHGTTVQCTSPHHLQVGVDGVQGVVLA